MEKCFLCGDEYDNKKREFVIDMMNLETNEVAPICSITADDKVLALCPRCVKASVFGRVFNDKKFRPIVNVKYEEADG